jgi:IS30 family transposase
MPRKTIEIDIDELDKLLEIQCTLREIAGWFRCSEDTIEKAVKRQTGIRYKDYAEERRVAGLKSLRRAQWQKAVDKQDTTMLIWLGKQYLNQRDYKDINAKVEQTVIPQLEEMSKEELKALLGESDDDTDTDTAQGA